MRDETAEKLMDIWSKMPIPPETTHSFVITSGTVIDERLYVSNIPYSTLMMKPEYQMAAFTKKDAESLFKWVDPGTEELVGASFADGPNAAQHLKRAAWRYVAFAGAILDFDYQGIETPLTTHVVLRTKGNFSAGKVAAIVVSNTLRLIFDLPKLAVVVHHLTATTNDDVLIEMYGEFKLIEPVGGRL